MQRKKESEKGSGGNEFRKYNSRLSRKGKAIISKIFKLSVTLSVVNYFWNSR